jgi:hypothetical protein
MLTVLFALSTIVLIGSVFRPPRTLGQRAIVAFAAVLMLTVLIAWGIEFVMQTQAAAFTATAATAAPQAAIGTPAPRSSHDHVCAVWMRGAFGNPVASL